MKKLSAVLFLMLGLSVSALADQKIPRNSLGLEPAPNYAGVSTCEIAFATGTNNVQCAVGEGIVLDIVASSVATTDTYVIRDSSFVTAGSSPTYSIDKNSLDKAQRIFPRFTKGLTVQALVSPTASLATSRPNWTIVYTKDVK